MFITVPFTIARRWKQPKWPPADDRYNGIHPDNGILFGNNKEEAPIHTITRVNLEHIMVRGKKSDTKG